MPDSQHTHTEAVLQSHNDIGFNRDIRHVGEQTTMSSREIAELTGKRHDNVMRDTRDMLVELHGKGGLLKFEGTYLNDQNGQRYPLYDLPKRETLILVSGYNLTMRAKIIDRWQELEARTNVVPMIPQTLPEALRLAADLADDLHAERQRAALMEPKAEAFDRLSASDGSVTVTQAAKLLGLKVADLTRWMSTAGWVYRQNGSWVAYAQHIQNGRLEYKEANYTDQNTGMRCCKPYCHITPKGLAKLATAFGRDLAVAA